MSVVADLAVFPIANDRTNGRTDVQQDVLKFAEAALANSKREGLLLAVRARWVALAVTAVTLPILNPNWDVLYYLAMLGLFAAIGWAQLKVGRAGVSRPELFLMFCDLALMTFLAVVANPWSPVDWPVGMQFRFNTFIYFFVLLATATLAYSWRTVVAMGVWTAGLWVVGVAWAWFRSDTHTALAERVRAAVGSDDRMFALIDPDGDQYRRAVSGNHRLPDRGDDACGRGAPLQRAAGQPRRHRARAHQSGALFFAQCRRAIVAKTTNRSSRSAPRTWRCCSPTSSASPPMPTAAARSK